MKVHINSVGIFLATVGSFLVWKYLTELSWADKGAFKAGKGLLTIPTPTEVDIKRFRRQLWLSKLGLSLIVLGGAFQIASNHCFD
jgi:hypothetical protein